MKTKMIGKKLLCALLLACMLLSAGPGGAVLAAAPRTVETEGELAFDPLAETQSVAYEQHEAGYAVTLDQAADSVTLTVASAPASESARKAESVRLYIRTGVALDAGKTYRVGFALTAERAQADYSVCFDGAAAENAYGAPEARALSAPGTDRAEFALTPEAGSGELVLRLLLGNTGKEGNAFRLSDLAVEEASADTQGEYHVLVDSLRYGAQGSISYWTNDDCGAEMTADGESATLTVTKAPESGAEVWKIKLFARTGLRPEAGKAYRFYATVNASAGRTCEICYNEGDTEKGYGVLYNQQLKNGSQTFSRLIYIPRDKESAGEIVFQLSLGLLKPGDKVTISNVRVEEAIPRFQNALPAKFSFNTTHDVVTVNAKELDVMNASEVENKINWGGVCVTKFGDNATDLKVDSDNGTATLAVKGGSGMPYSALLVIDTGLKLDAGASYLVQFALTAKQPYDTDSRSYNVLYGTLGTTIAYESAGLYGAKLTEAEASAGKTIARVVTPDADGGLVIRLELGQTDVDNTVTVSDLLVKELDDSILGDDIAQVNYSAGSTSFQVRNDGQYGGILIGNGTTPSTAATIICLGGDAGEGNMWKRGLFTGNICQVSAQTIYRVSFDISADRNTQYDVLYGRGENEDDNMWTHEDELGRLNGLTATVEKSTVNCVVSPSNAGYLRIRIDLGRAEDGAMVTVSNIHVYTIKAAGENLANLLVYTEGDTHFQSRDGAERGTFGFGANSATMTCHGASITESWQRGLYTGNVSKLTADKTYLVTFKLNSTNGNDYDYEVCYSRGENADNELFKNETGFGSLGGLHINNGETHTVSYMLNAAADGYLRIRVELGKAAEGTKVTISDIHVHEVNTTEDHVELLHYILEDKVHFQSRDLATGTITTNDNSATMTCLGTTNASYLRGLYTGNISYLTTGNTYLVTFKLNSTDGNENAYDYEVCYSRGEDENDDLFKNDTELNAFGILRGRHIKDGETKTVTYAITPSDNGYLRIRVDLGMAAAGTQVTISDIHVYKVNTGELADLLQYYAEDGKHFQSRDGDARGTFEFGSGSATMTCNGDAKDQCYFLGLYTGNVSYLTAGKTYLVTFNLKSTNGDDYDYEVCYSRGDNEGDDLFKHDNAGEAFGILYGRHIKNGETQTVAHVLNTTADGYLRIRVDLGKAAEDTKVTISDIHVYEVNTGTDYKDKLEYESGGTHFQSRDGAERGTFEFGSGSATMTCLGTTDTAWQRGLYTGNIDYLTAHDTYLVTFNLNSMNGNDYDYEVCYSRGENESSGLFDNEKGFGSLGSLHINNGDTQTVSYILNAAEAGYLRIRVDLGMAATNTKVTISDIHVYKVNTGELADLLQYYAEDGKHFQSRNDGGRTGAFEFVTGFATMTCQGLSITESWQRGLYTGNVCQLTTGNTYLVSFKLNSENGNEYDYEVCYSRGVNADDPLLTNDAPDGAFGILSGMRIKNGETQTVTYALTPKEDGYLRIRVDLGKAPENTQVTISDIQVCMADSAENTAEVSSLLAYPLDFRVDGQGSLANDDGAIMMTCAGDSDGAWSRRLLIDNLCKLAADSAYLVSFQIKADQELSYEACYNKDRHFGTGYEEAFGAQKDLIISSEEAGEWKTVSYRVLSGVGGNLYLMLNVGTAANGTKIWVKDIAVRQVSGGPDLTGSFTSSVWARMFEGYDGYMTRDSEKGTATLTVTKAPDVNKLTNNGAMIMLRTGVTAEAGQGYIVNYKISAEKEVPKFSTIYLNGRSNNNYEWSEPNFGGQYDRSFSGSTTVSHRVTPSAGTSGGEITLQIELGNIPTGSNTFTISDVTIRQGESYFPSKEVNREAATYNMQGGYKGTISRSKESVTLHIDQTPTSGLEAWKNKLFIDPDIYVGASETFRVTMDVSAEQDMDFEVCYNRGDKEKDYDAVYDQHVAAGKTTTVERLFTASGRGRLIVQLSLGKVAAPNAVTVRNLHVERVSFDKGDNALPAPLRYTAPGAFSLSAPHAGYIASLDGTDESVIVNLAAAPAAGAEPWKVKLYTGTGATLQPGKSYRVSADITAKKAQRIEIAYNNGSEESGYDFLGLNVGAGETVETRSVITVPATKTDTKNLELQFNLGAATGPNEISIGGIRVEEVPLSYTDALPESFSYQSAAGVWVNPDCEATVESGEDYATIHVTAVPAGGAEVWKTKLLIHTGVYLQPGKVYQVRAALQGAKSQNYELCLNNEETESGFGVLYGQKLTAGSVNAVEHTITVPGNKFDAGELVLQFSVGGPSANDITVSGVSVQEVNYGGSGSVTPDTVIGQKQASGTAAGTIAADRAGLSCRFDAISSPDASNTVKVDGAVLRANELYTVTFTARAGRELTGGFTLVPAQGGEAAIAEGFALSPEARTYSFTTPAPLGTGGEYDLRWQFASPEGAAADGAEVEISDIKVLTPAESLQIIRSPQHVVVNGVPVEPDAYNINGSNYFKLRDLGALLDGTYGQFVVRYNDSTRTVSLATGRPYVPAGGELTVGADNSATCVRSNQAVAVDGKSVSLKAYNIGGNNFFRLRDLNELLGFGVSYDEASNTVFITSPLTPEKQEENHAYNLFFLPEVDGETQPYVGDTMPFYDDGIYYVYYLKEGGDSYNHSVYVATTTNFVTYTEYDSPVLSASRADVQDSWIGTGSVVKAEGSYYFFYTGFNASGSQEYHEKIMVAKSDSPTAAFEKVAGWAITPPDELGQKNDFRDPQAYYDPRTQTFTLTVTASMGGKARVLKYTLDKDLQNVSYDGVIFTDPTGAFYNLECTDTFQLGDTWYLTYSGQEDTVWYARSDKQFGPYTDAQRLDGKLFYAAKHVENGGNTYLVGWTRRSQSASSVSEVSGWGGNLIAQKVVRQADGSLLLVPVDGIKNTFQNTLPTALNGAGITLSAAEAPEYQAAFTAEESFLLRGQFQYTGNGAFGLAFDFNGTEEQYKLISLDPEAGRLSLSFGGGTTPIAETQVKLQPKQTYSFTYIQDGSVGIFYVDGQAALTVRVYGSTGKPICLFAENNSVTFSNLQEFVK